MLLGFFAIDVWLTAIQVKDSDFLALLAHSSWRGTIILFLANIRQIYVPFDDITR